MRFEIRHELDAPLDAVELAALSPEIAPRLALACKAFESVEVVEHHLERGELRRVLRFKAAAPLAILKDYAIARDAMTWNETWTYRMANHSSSWRVETKPEWQKYFRSSGSYRLEALSDGRTARIVVGDLEVHAGVLSPIIERVALSEVQKTYDAEATMLRELSSL